MSQKKMVLCIILASTLFFIAAVGWFSAQKHIAQTHITIGDATFTADVARTAGQRQQGLSNRSSLPSDQAMLFVFDTDAQWGVWMKDMAFPLDIIWLDAKKQIIHIVTQASPSTYPQTFTPPAPARFVVELPAGTVKKHRIHPGMPAYFALPQ